MKARRYDAWSRGCASSTSCCSHGTESGLAHGSRYATHETTTGLESRNDEKVSGCAGVRHRGTGCGILSGTSVCPPDSWSHDAPRVLENVGLGGTESGRHVGIGGWELGVGCPLGCEDGWGCAQES